MNENGPARNYQPTIALREYIEAQIRALDDRLTQRFDMEQQAVEKAERFIRDKLEGMNEIRGAMREQSERLLSKDTFHSEIRPLEVRLNAVENRLSNFDGRQLVISGIIAIVVSVAIRLLM